MPGAVGDAAATMGLATLAELVRLASEGSLVDLAIAETINFKLNN